LKDDPPEAFERSSRPPLRGALGGSKPLSGTSLAVIDTAHARV
jgi:hypothetical protein